MGLFDTVNFWCPQCRAKIEVQSKAGSCLLAEIDERQVPLDIAADIEGEEAWCKDCDGPFEVVRDERPPTTIGMYLLKR